MIQPFILLMQVVALLMIAFARHAVSGGADATNLLFIPASLLGTQVGMVLYRRLSDRQFARVVNGALIVSGIGYVI